MNYQRFVEHGCDEKTLPDNVQQHIAGCDACHTFMERDTAIRQLMALKRYERPDPEVASRIVYAVRQQIAEESMAAASPKGLWESFLGFSVPTLRYALASVLMAFLAIHTVLSPSMSVMQTQLPSETQIRTASSRPTIQFTNLRAERSSGPQVVRLASNPTPSRIQYGTLPSTLVGYEF